MFKYCKFVDLFRKVYGYSHPRFTTHTSYITVYRCFENRVEEALRIADRNHNNSNDEEHHILKFKSIINKITTIIPINSSAEYAVTGANDKTTVEVKSSIMEHHTCFLSYREHCIKILKEFFDMNYS